MMPKLPSRASLLVPLLALGLLVPGAGPTQADALPAPCGLNDVAEHAAGLHDDLLMLSAMLPADADHAQANGPQRPNRDAPPPPGPAGAPRPPGSDLRPPDQSLLNAEPVRAAREFRESLSDKQKADLQAVFAKHRDELQQARARLPELSAERQGNKPLQADREARLRQVSTELKGVKGQIDQEIDAIITPAQRALLQRAAPHRLQTETPNRPSMPSRPEAPSRPEPPSRRDMPKIHDALSAAVTPGC
jgi:hypothetical protein